MPPAALYNNQNRHRSQLTTPPPSDPPVRPSLDVPLQDSSPTNNSEDAPPPKRRRLITDITTVRRGRNKAAIRKDSTVARILQLAQFIKRGIDLWTHIPQAINVGTAAELLEQYKTMDPSDDDYNEDDKKDAELILENCSKEKDTLIKAFKGIMALFLTHIKYIDALNDEEAADLWRQVNIAAEQGRNNDTASIKAKAHKYVLKTGQPFPPIDDDKSKYGTSHPQLLRMIVPMSILHKNGADTDFEAGVKAKKYKIDHKSIPAFLFDADSWNPHAPDGGLLKGHFIVRVLRHILTGPSSAKTEPGKRGRSTRAGNATIAGQTEVTPEMIAYACVHARHFISKLEVFSETDERFNVKKFYYDIIRLFDNRESKWVKDTLAWWNEQVFGAGTEDEDEEEDDNTDEDETSFANILAMREAREAQETAPEEPAISQTQLDSQYTQDAFPDLH